MAGRKVLFIDADAASRKYIAAVLSKADYEVELAASGNEGLQQAIRGSPDLILVDPVLEDIPADQLASRLRSDPRTASLPLVALSSDARPARMKSCMQAGFSDYLIKSSEVVPALLESLVQLLPSLAPEVGQHGTLITFVSAKGGTGTSTLCANVSMAMAENRPGSKVAVADLVLPLGSLAGIVGYGGAMNLAGLTELDTTPVTAELLRHELPKLEGWGFHLLAGCSDPESCSRIDAKHVARIVRALRQAYDFVVLDLGRALSKISMPLITGSDLVVMVVGADPVAASLSRSVWNHLKNLGLGNSDVYVIMNRSAGTHGLTKDEAERIMGVPFNAAVPHQADNFSLAVAHQQAYSRRFPADTTSIIFKQIALEIVEAAGRKPTARTRISLAQRS